MARRAISESVILRDDDEAQASARGTRRVSRSRGRRAIRPDTTIMRRRRGALALTQRHLSFPATTTDRGGEIIPIPNVYIRATPRRQRVRGPCLLVSYDR